MKNPYEILGVREGASQDEIKQAYREQVKKYHPDKYDDNPLKDLAEDKMREINEAYEYLLANSGNGGSESSYSSGSYSNENYGAGGGSYTNYSFQKVREYIQRRNLRDAEDELNRINNKNAEWYFLRGTIAINKGWYSQGYQDIQTAVSMEPSNYEYTDALNRLQNNNRNYNNNSYARSYNRGSSDDICQMCTCLFCSDQMCECCGGDLISCC